MEEGIENTDRTKKLSRIFQRPARDITHTSEYEGNVTPDSTFFGGVTTDNPHDYVHGHVEPEDKRHVILHSKHSFIFRVCAWLFVILVTPLRMLNDMLYTRELKQELVVDKSSRRKKLFRLLSIVCFISAVILLGLHFHYKTTDSTIWNGFFSVKVEYRDHSNRIKLQLSDIVEDKMITKQVTTQPELRFVTSLSPRFFYPTLFYHDHEDGSELPLYTTLEEFEQHAASCDEMTQQELRLNWIEYFTNKTHTVHGTVEELFLSMTEFVKRHNHTERWWTFACATMFLPREPGWKHPCLCTVDMGDRLFNVANLVLLPPDTAEEDRKTYRISETVGYISELRNTTKWTIESMPLRYDFLWQDGKPGRGIEHRPEYVHRLRDTVRIMRGTFRDWDEDTSFSLPLQKRTFVKPVQKTNV